MVKADRQGASEGCVPARDFCFSLAIRQLLGVGEQVIVPDEERSKNTLTFSVIGLIALLLVGLFNQTFRAHDPRLALQGTVQLLEFCFLMVPTVFLAAWGRRPHWAENLLVLAGFVIFASNVVLGGQSGDALYWTFVYPYMVFFLRGQQIGWVVGILYLAIVPFAMFFSSRHWAFWVYQPAECVYYAAAYAFNVLTAAHFNLLRCSFQKQLWEEVEFNTSEVRRHLESLQFNATHDLSTGLHNRQGTIESIRDLLAAGKGSDDYLFVVCIRFIRIKELASIVGMDNVNASLASLAGTLRQLLPGLIDIGRTRQDELAVLIRAGSADASVVDTVYGIEFIRADGAAGEFSVHEEFAFGVAIQPMNESAWAGELLRKAEQALLFADHSRQRCQFYDAALNEHFIKRNRRYEKVRAAIFDKRLVLHYQPQLALADARLVGAEALVRWFDDEEGAIPPDEFIPIIESTGLLHRFSLWTIEQAMVDCAAWQSSRPGVTVSINLSADALHDPEVVRALQNGLVVNRLDPALVIVELTESVMLKSPEIAMQMMHRIVDLGIRLSIDDYGAGFSSLSYVKQLPAHEMKIDKSFIAHLPASELDHAIVSSSIELGHDFGLQVLAEGIEDCATLQLLREAGCDLGQGWLFSKALPVERFIMWTCPPLDETSS